MSIYSPFAGDVGFDETAAVAADVGGVVWIHLLVLE